jgi:hypothetical protein
MKRKRKVWLIAALGVSIPSAFLVFLTFYILWQYPNLGDSELTKGEFIAIASQHLRQEYAVDVDEYSKFVGKTVFFDTHKDFAFVFPTEAAKLKERHYQVIKFVEKGEWSTGRIFWVCVASDSAAVLLVAGE